MSRTIFSVIIVLIVLGLLYLQTYHRVQLSHPQWWCPFEELLTHQSRWWGISSCSSLWPHQYQSASDNASHLRPWQRIVQGGHAAVRYKDGRAQGLWRVWLAHWIVGAVDKAGTGFLCLRTTFGKRTDRSIFPVRRLETKLLAFVQLSTSNIDVCLTFQFLFGAPFWFYFTFTNSMSW